MPATRVRDAGLLPTGRRSRYSTPTAIPWQICRATIPRVNTPQREHWSGEPALLGESWRLHKSGCAPAKEAICRLQSHVFGLELILEINGSLYASQVCRNSEQALRTSEQWKKAMVSKGWT